MTGRRWSIALGMLAVLLVVGAAQALEVGQKAPDFTLPAPGNKPVKLTELTTPWETETGYLLINNAAEVGGAPNPFSDLRVRQALDDDDPTLVLDMIEGETGLVEALTALLEDNTEDEILLVGLKSKIDDLNARLAAWVVYGGLEEILTGWVLGQLPDGDRNVDDAERTAIGVALRGLTI